MSTVGEAAEENPKREDLGTEYEKPSTHTNFWKTFGLETNTGKLLYRLYGEKPQITPSAFLTKKEITEEEREKQKKKKEEEEEKERLRKQKMHISYPTYKKKEKTKEPEKISQRKPLAKILEETNNYEATTRLPEQLPRNRNEEKKLLAYQFAQEKCKMVPESCAQLTLTEEEKKEILKSAENRQPKYHNETGNMEEVTTEKIKANIKELEKDNSEKLKHLNKLNQEINKIDEYSEPKEYNKLKLQKIELFNEIQDNKNSIQKSKQVLESLK